MYDGTIASLRRFKDDVKEVREGFECGIGIENFNDIKVGDVIECYRTEQVARTLDFGGGRRLRNTASAADRVAEAIRDEVATFLAEAAKDPRIVGFVTVTGVEVTRDLRHAQVLRERLGSETETQAHVRRTRQRRVAPPLARRHGAALRVAPEIQFRRTTASRARRASSRCLPTSRDRTPPRRVDETTTDRSAEDRPPVQGLLLVDKPAGMTSHDVVRTSDGIYGERASDISAPSIRSPPDCWFFCRSRDPARHLSRHRAQGVRGDDYVWQRDRHRRRNGDGDPHRGSAGREATIRAAVTTLTGKISQIPPAYSAKSVDGTRAYDAARRGTPLDLPAVEVAVHSWDIRELRGGTLSAIVTCSGGTYIRALARDLGRLTSSPLI